MPEILLIFHIRKARLKAREAAICEAEGLLRDLNPVRQTGGPLSDHKGVFWLTIPADALEAAESRFPYLGYSEAVDTLEPGQAVKWRGERYDITRLYSCDEEALRELAPDRRVFALEIGNGEVRQVRGYRGDGGQLSKRGLPVYDARVLVNLVTPLKVPQPEKVAVGAQRPASQTRAIFEEEAEAPVYLDPFAGVGGIVIEAVAQGYQTLSLDIDPALRFGLRQFGATHEVGDAAHLPYADASIDAIASEPPYDPDALPVVAQALHEMARVLKFGGKIALLCAEAQADVLREAAINLSLQPLLDTPLDRKGLPCAILAWEKHG